MNNTIAIILTVVVIGIGAYFFTRPQPTNNVPSDDVLQEPMADGIEDDGTAVMEDGAEPIGTAGSYEPYAPELLARATDGDVVLFFRATWCPTCRTLDDDIRAHLGDIPAGLTILDVDYDDSDALKTQYGVTYQHTLVQVDVDGNLLKKWGGSPTLAALVSEVE